jgi:hypothetical protein
MKDDAERPNSVFNIGSQQGVISNVGGDQTVYGGQRAEWVEWTPQVEEHLEELRRVLSGMQLPEEARQGAEQALDEASTELQQPEPDKERVAGRIERFTEILKGVGELAVAGLAIVNPIQSIAGILGSAGAAIIRLIRD